MNKEIDLGLYVNKNTSLPKWSEILTIEKLLSLHSHWYVSDLEISGNNFSLKIKDHATEKILSLKGAVEHYDKNVSDDCGNDFLRIDLNGDVSFAIAMGVNGDGKITARIILEEKTLNSNNEESALLWLRGIREYIRLYLVTNLNTLFFRIVMDKMILKMNPSQRKICLMITKITVIELLVVVIIAVGYVNFMK